jgi:hypothetical protein
MRPKYEDRLRELESVWARARGEHLSAGAILALTGIAILLLAPYASRQHFLLWWLVLLIPVAATSVRRFRRYQAAQSRIWRLKLFYTRGLERVTGEWMGKGFDGTEFQDTGHPYARDLGVFGEGSLFELMCNARTAIGRRRLAAYLAVPAPIEEVRLRQQAVAELEPRAELREEVAVLGEYESAESRWETFAAWLDSPPVAFPKCLRAAARLSSALLAGTVLATLLTAGAGLLPWARMAIWISPLLVFHTMVGMVYRRRVNAVLESVRPLSVETRVVREGLQLLESRRFQSVKLAQISGRVRQGAQSVRRLEWLLDALNQRDKDGFYFLSRVLLSGTQGCMALEEWRRQHGVELRDWLDAWSEFEALNALGSYAHENPEHTFPELSTESVCYEATRLGHPLLRNEVCVRNDVRLDGATRFYMISGSNMSGKSTLMRAIGLNAVLAFAGAPVHARRLRLSALSVCASIAVWIRC